MRRSVFWLVVFGFGQRGVLSLARRLFMTVVNPNLCLPLAKFRASRKVEDHQVALREIQTAYDACIRYVDHSQARYHSQMLVRTGLFDWSAMLAGARQDVAIVRASLNSGR